MGFVISNVGDMGCLLCLVVAEDYGGASWSRGDMGDKLRVGVDYTLRIAVGLGAAIAHDPGCTG